ncbi:hypothetical protein Mapa_013302 [Marchantia paleacea]|nr:hypothetical protein Mapa_013302 [Marchantia paleacea]
MFQKPMSRERHPRRGERRRRASCPSSLPQLCQSLPEQRWREIFGDEMCCDRSTALKPSGPSTGGRSER